jgi:tripartite motif-containing protein 71
VGELLQAWGSTGRDDGQFLAGPDSGPQGLAVDAQGRVYVTDHDNDRIQQFDGTGGFLATWGTPGLAEGQLRLPFGVTVDPRGNLYVTDSGHAYIQKFDRTGHFVARLEGGGDWPFARPPHRLGHVAVDDQGALFVIDARQEGALLRFRQR